MTEQPNEPNKPNELNEPNELKQLNELNDQPGGNHVPTPDELAALKAQLEEEQAAVADARAQLTAREERISELETELLDTRASLDAGSSLIEQLQEANAGALGKYLEAVKAANLMLPQDVIGGETIEAIDRSLATALSIAGAVKANLEAEAKNARVPAGAPTRAVDMDALTPEEKIKVGLSNEKGGTS